MAPWEDSEIQTRAAEGSISATTIAYLSIFCTLLGMSFVLMCMKMSFLGQKTRSPQQRRMYVGSRARPSLGQTEPTIFVSPSNLPPPPKYECMAPPSYEEVVGIHYPNYQVQPITQPISTALAQSSNAAAQNSSSNSRNNDTDAAPETVITVASETSRTPATATRS